MKILKHIFRVLSAHTGPFQGQEQKTRILRLDGRWWIYPLSISWERSEDMEDQSQNWKKRKWWMILADFQRWYVALSTTETNQTMFDFLCKPTLQSIVFRAFLSWARAPWSPFPLICAQSGGMVPLILGDSMYPFWRLWRFSKNQGHQDLAQGHTFCSGS